MPVDPNAKKKKPAVKKPAAKKAAAKKAAVVKAAVVKARSPVVSPGTARAIRRGTSTVAKLEGALTRAEAERERNAVRARALIAEIAKHLASIAEDSHRIGVCLTELREPRLYLALGYDSFAALLYGEDLMSRALAHRLITVAATYSPEALRALGVSKAYALVTYVRHTPAEDVAATLVEYDARVGKKPISKSTTREITAAAKKVALRSRVADAQRDPVADAEGRAAAVERALRARGFEDIRLALRLVRGHHYVDLRLRLEDAERLVD
jgi:hypothetical protein